jgi:type II secretory pathway component PulM
MGLLPQNPRDQKLLVLALAIAGGAAVYQQMYWTPKNEELSILAARLDTLDSLNKVAKADVARGSATKMKQEAEEFARELAVLRHLVPP